MLDRERFKRAAARAIEETEGGFLGIGRLSEKVMHRTLKLYYEPDEAYHEIELAGSVADIKNEWGVTEIQRSNLAYMLPKLERFLPHCNVRVVHPIDVRHRVRWLDRETGEISPAGRPVTGKRPQDVALEIYKIREYIGDPRFELVLLCIECDEYRALDGWDKTRKKGASHLESIPRELVDEIIIREPSDLLTLLPDTLGASFTEKEFRRAIKSRSRYSYYTLRLLVDFSLLSRHKEGNKYVYTRIINEG